MFISIIISIVIAAGVADLALSAAVVITFNLLFAVAFSAAAAEESFVGDRGGGEGPLALFDRHDVVRRPWRDSFKIAFVQRRDDP